MGFYKALECKHLEVLKSPAGFYIGSKDSEGYPNCRASEGYFKKEEIAKGLLDKKAFIPRLNCMEGCDACEYTPEGKKFLEKLEKMNKF